MTTFCDELQAAYHRLDAALRQLRVIEADGRIGFYDYDAEVDAQAAYDAAAADVEALEAGTVPAFAEVAP